MNYTYHICIVTTSHRLKDSRIYHKQALSLLKAGYRITMIAQADCKDGDVPLKVISLKNSRSRFDRYILNCLRAFFIILRIRADIYHFHDPELLPVGAIMRIIGKRVIFDLHENYYEKMKSKRLPRAAKFIIGTIWRLFEYVIGRMLNHIIVVDSYTLNKFPRDRASIIANYAPLRIGESVGGGRKREDGHFKVVYVGGISSNRGIEKINEALTQLNDSKIELHLAGSILNVELKKRIENYSRSVYHGFIQWEDIGTLLRDCDLGLALYQPVSAYLYSTGEGTIKIYEYMAVGLPVLISDFPKLKALVESLGCGIAVDATSPKAIAEAIKYLRDNPNICKRMGENGQRAFYERFNWEIEEKKLLRVYRSVLKMDQDIH